MLPVSYIGIYISFIALSGVIFFNYFAHYTNTTKQNSLLLIVFAWLWFNLFIALYEFYIVYNKRKFTHLQCPSDFWSEPVTLENQDQFWLKAWHEYTCYSDTRYLEPSDSVFIIEATNAVLVVFLWMAWISQSYTALIVLLLLQAICCIVYFITLYTSRKINTQKSAKTAAYLLLSSLWIFAPLTLAYYLSLPLSHA